MFTLFKSSPKFPVLKPVNIRLAHNYLLKFEESLKNFEEIQKEALHSWIIAQEIKKGYGNITFYFFRIIFLITAKLYF